MHYKKMLIKIPVEYSEILYCHQVPYLYSVFPHYLKCLFIVVLIESIFREVHRLHLFG